jgi:release factor glutamine methyltransferase
MIARTYREAYVWASSLLQEHKTKDAKFESELLLRKSAGILRHQLFLRWDEPLPMDVWERYQQFIITRSKHAPIQYIINEQEFYGRTFYVDERVLIPRPETELLVEQALARVQGLDIDLLRILDIGTGSGAVAISLALELCQNQFKLTRAIIEGVDISSAALEVAKINADNLVKNLPTSIELNWVNADVWPAQADKFHMILSNPPYIDWSDEEGMDCEVKNYEPKLALFADDEGLAIYKQIIYNASKYLHKDGWLGFECGYKQAQHLSELLQAQGFSNVQIYKDLAGHERVIFAQLQ